MDIDSLTTGQVAAILGTTVRTIQQMVDAGVLDASKTAGGHRRVSRSSVDAVLAARRQAAGIVGTDTPLESVETVTTGAAARILEVSISHIHHLVDRGELPAWKTPGGHRRVRKDAVEAFLESQGRQRSIFELEGVAS